MSDAGITKAMADQTIELRIFGIGITEETGIAFTKYDKGDEYATVCQVTATKVFKVGFLLIHEPNLVKWETNLKAFCEQIMVERISLYKIKD